MSVTTETSSVEYLGNGATTAFPISFAYLSNAHVVVTLTSAAGAETVLQEGVGYTISSGNVVAAVAPASGETLTIEREVPYTQPTAFRGQGSFSPALHEDALDRAAMQAQQLDRRTTGLESRTDELEDRAGVLETTASTLAADIASGDAAVTAHANSGDAAVLASVASSISSLLDGFEPGSAMELATVIAEGAITPRTLASRLAETISVRDFGAVGDGVADDTAAVHAAIDAAKEKSATVFFPPGTYRVTSGYTQSVSYRDVRLLGTGSNRENILPQRGSCILLDSTDPASFFYQQTARHQLQVEHLIFRCAQYVQDRAFFRFTSGHAVHHFRSCNFQSVERPIVYVAGCYFQNASLTDVQFYASGTIHSETTSLVGTLLVLNNVNHESTVPVNTEAIVCNLSGVRQIQATNFLLEGVLPASGWTVLKIANFYDADWTGAPTAEFHGFWSEWAGTVRPLYTVHQERGSVSISSPGQFAMPTAPYRLAGKGKVKVEGASFVGSEYDVHNAFVLDDVYCTVILANCHMRSTRVVDQRIVYENCIFAASTLYDGQSILSNSSAEKLISFDGGYFDPSVAVVAVSTTHTPSVDSTFGRKYLLASSTGSAFHFNIAVPGYGGFKDGDQFIIVIRLRLPTFTGGFIQLQPRADGVTVANRPSWAATLSGTVVEATTCFRIAGDKSTVGLALAAVAGASGITGNLEIYTLAVYRGRSIPNSFRTPFPNNVVTFAPAAPTAGEWKRGDRVYNTAPSAGGTPGWVCVTAGTPGTWRAMANLAP